YAIYGPLELVVHGRVRRVAEVEVVGDAEWRGADAAEVAGGLGDRVRRAEARLEVDVARVAVGGRGDAERAALDAQHGGVRPSGDDHGVGHHLVVEALVHRALVGDRGRREQRQQGRAVVFRFGQRAEV